MILADPPWSFATRSAKGKGRSAEAYYDCMSLEAIRALPVAERAAKDCVLFLWVTDPMLQRAFSVIEAWGFQYKTVGFYWAKTTQAPKYDGDRVGWSFGCGYWTRANPEQCLLATRGHPKPQAHDVRRLIVSPRRLHSQKPEEVYGRIERLCRGPYLELFARGRREGWSSWGNEIDAGPGERRWASNSYPEAAE